MLQLDLDLDLDGFGGDACRHLTATQIWSKSLIKTLEPLLPQQTLRLDPAN